MELLFGYTSIYAGYIPSRAFGLVMEWALLHQSELLENWNLAKQDQRLRKIEPLK